MLFVVHGCMSRLRRQLPVSCDQYHGKQDGVPISRCGAVAVGSVCLLPPLSSGGARVTLALTPFPHPAHRTQRADLPHWALGQDITPSHTPGYAPTCAQTYETEVPVEVRG